MKSIKEYFNMLSNPSIRMLMPSDEGALFSLQSKNDDNLSLILDTLDWMQDYEDEDDSNVIGIFENAELVGFIICAYLDDESYYVDEISGSEFEYRIINDITVSPKHRARGIAEALISYNADKILDEEEVKSLALFADPLTPQVVPFYIQQGFVECGDLLQSV